MRRKKRIVSQLGTENPQFLIGQPINLNKNLLKLPKLHLKSPLEISKIPFNLIGFYNHSINERHNKHIIFIAHIQNHIKYVFDVHALLPFYNSNYSYWKKKIISYNYYNAILQLIAIR